MNNSERVRDMYFNLGLKPVEIAEELNITKAAVSKILKVFGEEYIIEKERRKSVNRQNNREDTVKYIRSKREDDRELYNCMKIEHEQTVMGMSSRSKMSSLSIVIHYLDAYDLSKSKKSYVFNENRCGRKPADMPERRNCKLACV